MLGTTLFLNNNITNKLLYCYNQDSPLFLLRTKTSNGIPSKENIDLLWQFHNFLYPKFNNNLKIFWQIESNRMLFVDYPNEGVYLTVLNSYDLPDSVIVKGIFNNNHVHPVDVINKKYVNVELNMLRSLKHDYAVGSFYSGSPNEKMIEYGIYDELLLNSKYMFFDIKTKFPFELGELFPNNINLPKEYYQELYSSNQKWDNGEYLGFNIRRYSWFEKRCKEIGCNMPDVYIKLSFEDDVDFLGIESEIILNYLQDNILFQNYIKGLFI